MINAWNIFRTQPSPAEIRAEIKNATTPVFKKIEEGIDELGAELVLSLIHISEPTRPY